MPMPKEQTFTQAERIRYSRQIMLSGFGEDAQLCLSNSSVLIAGAGGLGCPIGIYLAAAGVGRISVVDYDVVELSNLHRQVAYKTKDLKKPKAEMLVDTMRDINPELQYEAHNQCLSADNVAELISNCDLVIDGTDNFATRFLLADACYFSQVSLLHGSVYQYSAQIMLFTFGDGPCFRCLYSQPPSANVIAACNEAGILGVVTGVVGTIMATAAVKYFAGRKVQAENRLLKYDAMEQSLKKITLKKDSNCPLCGEAPTITTLLELAPTCVPKDDFTAVPDYDSISIEGAKRLIADGAFIVDVREPVEYARGHIANAVLVPLSTFQEELPNKVPHNKPVLVYCQHGVRSQSAVDYMRQNGYAKSYSMEGGFAAWGHSE